MVSWTSPFCLEVYFCCCCWLWRSRRGLQRAQEPDPPQKYLPLYRLQSGGPDPDWENPDPVFFMEELNRNDVISPLYVLRFVLFLTLHYAWGPRLSTFCLFLLFFCFVLFWPDVVYLNFVYRKNDLVTCVRYNKVTMKVTDTENCYLHVQMLSLNNYRGNIFLYF